MPVEILSGDAAVPIAPLTQAKRIVAVLGYGNQGAAHALNLRDSGVRVLVGARGPAHTVQASSGPAGQPARGEGAARAVRDGFEPVSLEEATAGADLVIVALPDEVQPHVLHEQVIPNLRPGATLGFLHGFTVHFGLLPALPDGVGVVMVAPKGPGRTLRDRYQRGQGIPCLLALHRESAANNARDLALAWANGIGCARAGVILTSFRDETITDLFGEQAVLCGGVTGLILAAFQALVDAGYPAELAYLECCHEVKQVADLVYERGLSGMMQAISNTAEFGAHQAMPVVVDDAMRLRLRTMLTRIEDGSFARDLRVDHQAGFPWFNEQRVRLNAHAIESAGRQIRSLMPWIREAAPEAGE